MRGFKATISKLVRGRAHIENNITHLATDSWFISLYSFPIFFNSVREMRLRTSTVDLWMTLWFRGPTHWGTEHPPITHSQLSIPQVLCMNVGSGCRGLPGTEWLILHAFYLHWLQQKGSSSVSRFISRTPPWPGELSLELGWPEVDVRTTAESWRGWSQESPSHKGTLSYPKWGGMKNMQQL